MGQVTKHYDKLFFVDRYELNATPASNEGYVITRLQSGNWDQEVTEEDIEEIGHDGIVETIIDPNIPTSLTLNTNDWGSVDFLCQLIGDDGSAYDPAGAQNEFTVKSSDVKYQKSDFLVRVRDNDTGNLDRSVWIPSAVLDSINWSYSVDGAATENFTFTGNTDRHYFGEFKDAAVDIGTYASSSTFTTNQDPGATPDFVLLYISVNGTVYGAAGSTWTTSTTVVDISGSSTGIPDLVSGDRLRVLYYRDTASDVFTELDSSEIGAIKGSYVEIDLVDPSQSTDTYTVGLQSVDINATMTRDDLKQLGDYESISRPMTKQEVTIEATMLENDLENWAYLLGVTTAEWTARDTTGIERSMQNAIGNALTLDVRVYEDYTKTDGNLLKTLTITDVKLTKSPFNLNVGGNGEVSLSLKADNWQWDGEAVTGTRLADSYPTQWL